MFMRVKSLLFVLLCIILTVSCRTKSGGEENSKIEFLNNQADNKLDILINGKLFTSFCWPDDVYKPILYPVLTSAGTEITRGFPLHPREGEQVDHIHQVGIWLNYGNVNGFDFWGNGYRGVKEPNGGVIKHLKIERLESRNGKGSFVSAEKWLDPAGNKLLTERTQYYFTAIGKTRIIDRVTTLTAGDTSVVFKDTKEGMFGIRVARQLELPSKEGVILIGADGNPSAVKDTLNKDVSGNYRSSEGTEGAAVWGTRAKWMDLSGIIGNEKISVVVCDHPENPGYPTYWHARGYGLFAANPLGWSDFTKGKETLGFMIPAKKSAKFRYRVIISSGTYLTDSEINRFADEFNKMYKRN
jgi:hypothetical protein